MEKPVRLSKDFGFRYILEHFAKPRGNLEELILDFKCRNEINALPIIPINWDEVRTNPVFASVLGHLQGKEPENMPKSELEQVISTLPRTFNLHRRAARVMAGRFEAMVIMGCCMAWIRKWFEKREHVGTLRITVSIDGEVISHDTESDQQKMGSGLGQRTGKHWLHLDSGDYDPDDEDWVPAVMPR